MNKLTLLGVSSFSVTLLAFLYMRISHQPGRKRKNGKGKLRQQKSITEDDLWNTAIFFPDYFPENEDSKTRQLIWYLEQATSTMDICVYGFAFKMIEDTLIRLAKEGVQIRIVSNRHIRANRQFKRAGIQTRVKRHLWKNPIDKTVFNDLMHNKFVVIDNTASLSGSLNWTWSSITENWENVVITNEPRIVEKYRREFERLWEECGWKLETDITDETCHQPC